MRSFIAAMGLSLVVAGGNLSVAPYRSPQLYGPAASDPSWLLSIANPPEPEPVAVAVEAGGEWHPPEYARAPHMLPFVLDVLPQARPVGKILLARAERHIGSNPTGWASLWCARFMCIVAPEICRHVLHPNLARSWASLPNIARRPVPGDIVVLARPRGGPTAGHIGVVKEVRENSIKVVSGNTFYRGKRSTVGVNEYPMSRVLAFVDPMQSKFHAYREPVT